VLHEIAELLGLIGDRQWRGTQTFFQQAKYSSLAFRRRPSVSVSIARTLSAEG
jgi:hypothetical protein